jgi:steroid delta-isomerase-like uncharacterized protein
MAANAELIRSSYDAWNRRDFGFMEEHVTPDATLTMVGSGQVLRGKDGVRSYGEQWAQAFPDGTATVETIIEQGDKLAVEFTGRGTHTGTLVTPMGDIPATGRSVTLHFLDIFEFSGDKVCAQRTYLDTGSLMAQLGITAGATAATQ